MNKEYQKRIHALFLVCLIAICTCFPSGNLKIMAATTLISQMDEVEVSPNVSRYDSFKTTKTGSLKITLSGSGSCTASLYYAGEDWDSSVSGDGDFIFEQPHSFSVSAPILKRVQIYQQGGFRYFVSAFCIK